MSLQRIFMTNIAPYLTLAHKLADIAATITLPLFRNISEIHNKQKDRNKKFDPVTKADKEAEKVMRHLITKEFPDHSIFGEEFSSRINPNNKNQFQWIIDPIDGTCNFISGVPLWGTLIAFAQNHQPIIGIMDQPFTGERFVGINVQGQKSSILRHQNKIHNLTTSTCRHINHAIIATTDPYHFENTPAEAVWAHITKKARLINYGGDCYHYALVAAGKIDAVIEQNLKIYDIQALIPMIQVAGGIITNWRGEAATQGGQILACSTPQLHRELMKELASTIET